MALTRFFLAILVVIISAKSSIAQDWNLVKSANGIDVYTRENPNSNFNAFRAEMTVTSNVAEMEYILKKPG